MHVSVQQAVFLHYVEDLSLPGIVYIEAPDVVGDFGVDVELPLNRVHTQFPQFDENCDEIVIAFVNQDFVEVHTLFDVDTHYFGNLVVHLFFRSRFRPMVLLVLQPLYNFRP